jgi:hypothetical protein
LGSLILLDKRQRTAVKERACVTKPIGFLLLTLALTSVHPAEAQQTGKVARIGFLGPTSASGNAGRVEVLRKGLRDLGYIEGKNLVIELKKA